MNNTLTSIKPVVALLLILLPLTTWAKDIRIIGRKAATVTKADIILSDLADVTSKQTGNDDALIALKKITIAPSPNPGTELTLAAQQILEKLKIAGVDFQTVGYMFPKVVSVKRAGRKLDRQELQAVMERELDNQSRELVIKNFNYNRSVMVPTGEIELSAQMFSARQEGQIGFAFEARANKEAPQRFEIIAMVDEWQDVPVAARPLARGSMLRENDIKLERQNITQLPRDAALSLDSLAGYSISQDVGLGEVFRRNKLSIPPVINMGQSVSLVYKSGGLEANASGTAMESGAQGDEIKVRNDSSRKIILGRVLEPGIVGVGK